MKDFFSRLTERTLGVAPLVRPVSPLLTAGRIISGRGFPGGSHDGEGEHEIDQAAPTAAVSMKSLTGHDSDLPRITLPQGDNVRSSPRVILPSETARDLTNAGEGQSSEVVARQQQESFHFREGEGDEAPLHSDSIMRLQSSSPSSVSHSHTNDLPLPSREMPQGADSTGDRLEKPGGESPEEHVRDAHRSEPSGEGDLPTQHYEKVPKYGTVPLKVVISRHDAAQDEREKSFEIHDRDNDAASARFRGVIRPAVPAPTAVSAYRRELLHSRESQDNQLSTIKITIGRIDVRAVTQQKSPPIRRVAPQKPGLSLDEYLRRRSGATT